MRKKSLLSMLIVLTMTMSIVSPISNVSQAKSVYRGNEPTNSLMKNDKVVIDSDNAEKILEIIDSPDRTEHILANLLENNEGNDIENMDEDSDDEHSITQVFQGVLEEENDYLYIPFTLSSGQILQSTLEGPDDPDINYDLLLYEFDEGNMGNLIARCGLSTYYNTYESGTEKSVEDAISYINSEEDSHSYLLFVYATEGCSSTKTFTLTISLDSQGYYDQNEPNDNPFNATTIQTGETFSGSTLNVVNDQDWYVWYVSSSIVGAKLLLNNSNFTSELYKASGTSMVLKTPSSSGYYSLNAGYYYIRVNNQNENFSPEAYTLTVQPYSNTASNVEVVSVQSDTSPSIANYGSGYYARAKRNLTLTARFTSNEGYPVAYQDVSMTWQSETWIEESGNKYRYSRSGITTNINGEAVFVFSYISSSDDNRLPTAIGEYTISVPGPVSITHHYDIAYMGFFCNSSVVNYIPMYHLAYSD